MPISKIPVGAIESGSIATSQIADNAITTAKILNDNVTSAKIPNSAVGSTELSTDSIRGLSANNSESILLNGTDGSGSNSGDALVLDGTDNSSANANDRILFDETFNPSTFNIGSGTSGQALLVAANGGFEFGSGGEKNDIYWSAYGSTDQTNISNNTIQQVVFNEVRYQSSHNGYDTSTGEFSCPAGGAGFYFITGLATIGGTGTANNHTRSIYNHLTYNATASGGGTGNFARSGSFMTANYFEGTQGSNAPVSGVFQLNVGDRVFIRAQAYGNNFSIDNTTSNAHFSGFRVLAI